MRYKTGLAIILACLLSVISIQGSRAQQRAPEERPPVYDLQQKPEEKPPTRVQQRPTIVPGSKEEKKEEKKDEFREYKPPAEQRPLEGRPPVRNK
jgi:hypothetical protein